MRHLPFAALLILAASIAACSSGTGASPAASSGGSAAPADASASADVAAATRVDVVGTDYAYAGIEASYAGPVSMAFRNEGTEIHEMVVVRKNDGVTEPFEDLLALPEDQALDKVSMVGVAYAAQGETSADLVTVDQPGEYMVVCFIPQGTTSIPSMAPDASGPPAGLGDGPPHFSLGMLQEFTIDQ